MSNRLRRFEVLLPLQFNDGRDVPSEWLADAVLEVADNFGAASYERRKLKGIGVIKEFFIVITWSES